MSKENEQSSTILQNGLSDLVSSLYGSNFLNPSGQSPVIQTNTAVYNTRSYLISNNRTLLSNLYVEHGIVQTLVEQPVDDAFRTGFEMKTGQLSPEEIEELEVYLEKHRVIDTIKQACKWARLYGGGGVIIATDQNPAEPLDLDTITPDTPLKLISADMWELYLTKPLTDQNPIFDDDDKHLPETDYFAYYGKQVHKSRVYCKKGKEAPSWIKPRLRGWGMSELERLITSINQYMKNNNVIFELLDEAKVDVFKMKNFNTALLNAGGTENVSKRIQMANAIKNYNNALTMDADDSYEQKQVNFGGLSDMIVQIRQGLAADLKMPVTKLFGVSSAGFNSGEDDIENYNSMIETEIRSQIKYMIVDIINICSRHLFGFPIEDLQIEFHPLRVLSPEQEEQTKNYVFNRIMSSYQSGVIDAKEFKTAVNKAGLLPIEINETDSSLDPLGTDFTVSAQGTTTE